MSKYEVDVAIIGAGTAGLSAYKAAKEQGASALLIEAGPYGTTCARVGCMPSKLLIAAAEAARHSQQAQAFGVHNQTQISGEVVMSRVQRERDYFVNSVNQSIERIPETDKLQGYAHFIEATRLKVGQAHVQAKTIVIATGSVPAMPSVFKPFADKIDDNESLFEWKTLPGSVAVFGAGAIGLELGLALHYLGVRVRIFGVAGDLANLRDPAIKRAALAIFKQILPIDVESETEILDYQTDKGFQIRFREGKDWKQESFDKVLMAAGRRPNLNKLNLEALSIELNPNGLPNFNAQSLQIENLPVFLAGDVNNQRPLLHEASDEGRIAGQNAASFPLVHEGLRRAPLGIVFTHPQIAQVGRFYCGLDPEQIVIGSVDFSEQGRSRVIGENQGLLHLYAERYTGRLLGAEMVGPKAEHLSHLLAWSCQQELDIREMLKLPFYHPVIEEGLKTALKQAARQLNHKDSQDKEIMPEPCSLTG